jgi:hypothetical protein
MHKILSSLKGFRNFEFNNDGDSNNDREDYYNLFRSCDEFCYGIGDGDDYGYRNGNGFGSDCSTTSKTLSIEESNA